MSIMKKIYDILYEICGDNRVYNPDCELVESGLLDSYAVIELFSRLEEPCPCRPQPAQNPGRDCKTGGGI